MEQPESVEDQVERMVSALMKGVEMFGQFEGKVGVGAVLTFTNRFMQTMVTLSPSQEEKEGNARKIAAALRHMAGTLEFQVVEEAKMKVH